MHEANCSVKMEERRVEIDILMLDIRVHSLHATVSNPSE